MWPRRRWAVKGSRAGAAAFPAEVRPSPQSGTAAGQGRAGQGRGAPRRYRPGPVREAGPFGEARAGGGRAGRERSCGAGNAAGRRYGEAGCGCAGPRSGGMPAAPARAPIRRMTCQGGRGRRVRRPRGRSARAAGHADGVGSGHRAMGMTVAGNGRASGRSMRPARWTVSRGRGPCGRGRLWTPSHADDRGGERPGERPIDEAGQVDGQPGTRATQKTVCPKGGRMKRSMNRVSGTTVRS